MRLYTTQARKNGAQKVCPGEKETNAGLQKPPTPAVTDQFFAMPRSAGSRPGATVGRRPRPRARVGWGLVNKQHTHHTYRQTAAPRKQRTRVEHGEAAAADRRHRRRPVRLGDGRLDADLRCICVYIKGEVCVFCGQNKRFISHGTHTRRMPNTHSHHALNPTTPHIPSTRTV
jgi:hypothetical protein